MTSVQFAKEVYHFYKTRPGKWYGNVLLQTEEQNKEAIEFDLYNKIDLIIKDVKRKSRGFISPSAWHAALFLEKKNERAFKQLGPLVFRGHGNSKWKFNSSLYREGVNVEESILKTDLLGNILNMFFGLSQVKPNLNEPTAQHYGIPTALLDFTFDPCIAVYFASTSKEPDNAAVLYTRLNSTINSGCQIILPPPFVERLYRQMGFFLRDEGDSLKELQSTCTKIEFPKDKSFVCYRNGTLIDIWKDNSWRKGGGAFSRYDNGKLVEHYDDNSIIATLLRFCERHFEDIKNKPYREWPEKAMTEIFMLTDMFQGVDYLQDNGLLIMDWLSKFKEYIYWCNPISYGMKNVQPNEIIIEHIVKSNPSIANVYFAAIRGSTLSKNK